MSVTNCTRSSAAVRPPDSLRNPSLPPGTDTMPEIEHVVVLMLEDHSYDNFLGTTGALKAARIWCLSGSGRTPS